MTYQQRENCSAQNVRASTIYLDAASTCLHKPQGVTSAVISAMQGFGNPGRGAHSHSLAALRCVYSGRKAIGELLGVDPAQVVFTSSCTSALNMAIAGLLKPGDHVVTTVIEHNSVLRPLSGFEYTAIGLKNGDLDYSQFAQALKPNTKAVVITAASNVTGLVVDLEFVAEFCKKHGLIFIVDAAQAAGLLPINADALGISALCFAGHKSLFGSQGIGGICVGKGIEITPTKFGGTGIDTFNLGQPEKMPERLEAGTLNTPGIAGLTTGVEYILDQGMNNILQKSLGLARNFYERVSMIHGVKLYSGKPTIPIVTINIDDMESGAVESILSQEFGISVRGGYHCAPLLHRAYGTEQQGMVRFSFSCFNTQDEVDSAVKAVVKLAKNA